MKNKFLPFLLRFLFVGLCGVLLHFTYDWSGENFFVGLFSSVNESTWEHLKLLFFPMLALTIFETKKHSDDLASFLSARTLGILFGMLFIVVVFYTFFGITGTLIDFVNISIYFLGVLFTFFTENKLLKKTPILSISSSIFLLGVFVILFIGFTNTPIEQGIFYDLSQHPKS